ncbi:Ribosomal protein L34e superfamily protein [Striga hermonthica]|uniref:Ribosomal protein L34e superfamily protein n=1 Tax=Striga hermonthica TaxID=68872 RepID=A0A9N7NQB0_STRHE|nr:Ribosomal protein L34e superfamily protein [Striga hermonthica]
MRPHLLSSTIAMPPSSSLRKPAAAAAAKPLHPPSHPPSCPSLCRQSPSATLDLLIFFLVLFSGAFLVASYLSYLLRSLSLLLPPFSALIAQSCRHLISYPPQPNLLLPALFLLSLAAFAAALEICCGRRPRRCGRSGCRGLNRSIEFDLQLQGEELLVLGERSKAVRDVNALPWKGGSEDNPDYECLRVELRKMAPPNGRAVLLFCLRCGCPVSKLEGRGPTKRGRRHKKNLALTGVR